MRKRQACQLLSYGDATYTELLMKSIAVVVALLAAVGCRTPPKAGNNGAGLASVNISMPDLGDAKAHLTNYKLSIVPKDACANATQIKDQNGALGATIDAKVVKGCDYLVTLELGAMTGSAFTAYFSNASGAEAEKLLSKAELEKTPATFSAFLVITDAGRAIPALVALGNVTTPVTNDVNINVKFSSNTVAGATGRYDCEFQAFDADEKALDVGGADAKKTLVLDPAKPVAVHFGGYKAANGASLVVNYEKKTLTLLVSDVFQAAAADGISVAAKTVLPLGAAEISAEASTTRKDNGFKTSKSTAKCVYVK